VLPEAISRRHIVHKRAIGAAAITGVAALLMSACGSSTPDAKPAASATTKAAPAPATSGPPVRDAAADLVIWADADRVPIIQKYADEFGKENGIKVAVQVATDVRQQFKDATKVGKGPDVIVGAHDWLGELVQNNTVSPVNIAAADSAKFAPQAIAATQFNGQGYGVPYAVENIALVRNTALAPTAPASMSALVSAGQALVKSGKATNVLLQEVGKTGNAYYTYPYLKAFDGGIFATKANGDYDASKVIVNVPGSIKGATQMQALGKAKVLSTNVDGTNVDALFDTGKVPFFITGPWAIDKAKKANIKYAISPLPSLTGGGKMQPFLGVQMFYVSAKAKNAAFAQEFVTKYVPREDVQLALFEAGHRPPALTSAYAKAALTDPDVKAWFEAGQGGQPMPNIPAMNSVWGPLGQAAADVIAGKTPAKARFDAAQKEIVANIAKG
jgi:arabinogalactan oligomer/maltooligosaccharide transport system substrate-binding protein